MLTTLLILCIVIWLPVLLYQISYRGFLVLVIWLLVAPVASNLVNRPNAFPLFQSPAERAATQHVSGRRSGYFVSDRSISVRWNQLVEPTRTLLFMFVLTFLMEGLLKKRSLGPFDRTEIWMATFSLILLASVLFQSNVLGYSMRVTIDGFVVPFLAYFAMRRLVASEDRFHLLVRAIGYMGLSLIMITLLERMTHAGLFYRLGGPFRNGTTVYTVMAVVFFVALSDHLRWGSLVDVKWNLPQGVRWVVLSLAPVIILLTWSRGNWIGLLMGMCVFLFLGQRLVTRSQKLSRAGLALIIVAVIGLMAPEFARHEIVERRVGNIDTVRGRLATWNVVMQEGIKHPIFGIGLFNTRDVLYKKTGRFEDATSWVSSHNSFLAIFAEQGAVGLLAYLAIVASIVRMGLGLYRTGMHPIDRWRGVAVIAIMVAYLMPALFASTLHVPDPMTAVFLYAFVGAVSGLYGRHRSVVNPYEYSGLHDRESTSMLAAAR